VRQKIRSSGCNRSRLGGKGRVGKEKEEGDAWGEKERRVAWEIVAWGIGRNGKLTRKESGYHVSGDGLV
jgi:hypothetical protein